MNGTSGSSRLERFTPFAIAAVALILAAVATTRAVAWYGGPVAGILVDPSGTVSSVGLPDWDGRRQGLRFPDRVVEIDGHDLRKLPPASRGDAWNEALFTARTRDAQRISAVIQRDGVERPVELALHSMEPAAWWVLGGGLILVGLLYIGAALVALWARPRGKLARSFAKLATFAGIYNLALFDLHTSRELVPFFFLAFALVPGCFALLALRLPDDAPVLVRYPWLGRALDGLGLAFAAVLIAFHLAGKDTLPLQVKLTVVFGLAVCFFVATFVLRFVLARGERRLIMRALLLAMLPAYVVIGAWGILGHRVAMASTVELSAFIGQALAPLGTLYAFVRHDLWGSRALLSRVLTQAFVSFLVCAAAVALGAEIGRELGVPFRYALTAAAAGAIPAAAMVALALKLIERGIFRSRAAYKPTIEQLSAELTSIHSVDGVARAVERTVRRWLPCDHIEVVLEAPESWFPPESRDTAQSGFRQRIGEVDPSADEAWAEGQSAAPPGAALELPITFEAKRLGGLRVGNKRGGALFTYDDLDLLRTIVNQGALALAHARAYEELEQRRRQQAAAWRGEREALVETVAAELAHEVQHSLGFFRVVFGGVAGGGKLGPEEIKVSQLEIERLERLFDGLKRLSGHRIERRAVVLSDLCLRAQLLLKDSLGERNLIVDVDPALTLSCDADKTIQVLINLVSNALDAAGSRGRVGIRWQTGTTGGAIEIWDDGPGFVGDPARLFDPWYTTKPRGTGLGLAITHRLVRTQGWDINAARVDALTIFAINVPRRDIVDTQKPGRKLDQVA